MIILVGAQKGGVGKTTLAVNVAVELANRGGDVLLFDGDPQHSASNWHQYRDENDAIDVHCVRGEGKLSTTLRDVAKRYEYVVVDVAGRTGHEFISAMAVADVLISPMRPSQPDLDTIPKLAEEFESVRLKNDELRGLVTLNMCPTLPTIKEADQAQELLNEMQVEGLSLAVTRIHDRKAYRDSYAEGLSAVEWKDEKAANEIRWLVDEVMRDA